MNSKMGQHHKTEEREEEEEYGLRKMERKQDPREPSAEERLEHEKTHLPFRSWCRHCVGGRGKEEACREGKRSHDTAEVHMDFMFMGDEGNEKTWAMLVVREKEQRDLLVNGGSEEEQRRMVGETSDGIYAGSWR